MKPIRIRVYGPSRSFASFRAITIGYIDGFRANGAEVDFMATDGAMDEESMPPGTDAPVGLFLGQVSMTHLMLRHAVHKRRFVIIAPNASSFSPNLLGSVTGEFEFVSPSAWGVEVVKSVLDMAVSGSAKPPVGLLRHGVGVAFDPARLPAGRSQGRSMRALHITSTASSRKSTLETAVAFSQAAADGALGPDPKLVISCDFATYPQWTRKLSADGAVGPYVSIVSGKNVSWEGMGAYYRDFDCLIQPSRAEGFGMVPLEALCAGVPVIATACTGHTEFLPPHVGHTFGAVRVPHGPEEEMEDDSECATAPGVSVQAIKASTMIAWEEMRRLREWARSYAPAIYEDWKWQAAVKPWLDQIERELENA